MSLRRLPTRGERGSVGGLLAGLALLCTWFAVSHFAIAPRNPVIGGVLALFALCFALMAYKVFLGKARIPSRRVRHATGLGLIVMGTGCILLLLFTAGDAHRGFVAASIGLVVMGVHELRDRRR